MIKNNKKILVSFFVIEILLSLMTLLLYFDGTSSESGTLYFNFVFPEYLLLNVFGFLLALLMLFSVHRRNKIQGYGLYGEGGSALKKRSITFYFLLLRLSLSSFIVAAALPFQGERSMNTNRSNVELIFCLDLSKSMDVRDVGSSSRIESAKRILTEVVNNLNGEKIGLCVFAGQSIRQIESTRDYNYFNSILKNLQTDLISEQGTNVWEALLTAEEMFSTSKSARGIVVITDAENHNNVSIDVLKGIQENNISTLFIGVGSREGGKIPLTENGEFLRDENGTTVVSKMNLNLIDSLAQITSGSSIFFENEFPSVDPLLTEINLFKSKKSGNLNVLGNQLFHQWFVIVGMIFLTSSMFFSIIKKR